MSAPPSELSHLATLWGGRDISPCRRLVGHDERALCDSVGNLLSSAPGARELISAELVDVRVCATGVVDDDERQVFARPRTLHLR